MPFEIPASWEWTTVNDIAQSNIGLTYNPSEICNNGVPVLRSNNIKNQKLCWDDVVRVNSVILEKQYLQEGDLLICARNGSRNLVGKCALINNLTEPVSFGAFMAVCRSNYNPWIYYILHTDYFNRYLDDSNSTAINQVTQKMLLAFPVPFPPYEEQKRIVAEVQRWFDIIDTLEVSQQDLLGAIKQTKSRILDLAIHGKLVPQDSNDEPASELLKRINPSIKPCDTSHYENLPHNWSIARLESLCQSITSKKYQIKQSEIKVKGKYPVISQSANYIEGYSDLTDKVYSLSSPLVIFGDHTRIVKYVDFNFIVGADGVKILQPLIFPKYFYFLTEYSSTQIEDRGYGEGTEKGCLSVASS